MAARKARRTERDHCPTCHRRIDTRSWGEKPAPDWLFPLTAVGALVAGIVGAIAWHTPSPAINGVVFALGSLAFGAWTHTSRHRMMDEWEREYPDAVRSA